MVTTAVAAAALSFDLAKLKFPTWSFGKAIGCHQWTMAYGDIRPIDLSAGRIALAGAGRKSGYRETASGPW